MYHLSRLFLLLAVGLLAYCAVPVGVLLWREVPPPYRNPAAAFLIVGGIVLIARRKVVRRTFTAHGSAAWANENDAELERAGMLGGAEEGLILGRIPTDCRW